jgi:hypothetical protein
MKASTPCAGSPPAPGYPAVMTDADPSVAVYVASFQTCAATELCVRSIHEYAGLPLALTVGDSGSTDGSLEMLQGLRSRGWLELEVAVGGRQHADWIDDWLSRSAADFAVFVDSDVEFRRHGWLAEMAATGLRQRAALVYADFVDEQPDFVEPVGATTVRLAGRPGPWLLLVDVSLAARVGSSFRFHAEHTDAVPEGVIAYDVGARFFLDARRAGLACAGMPRSFTRAFHHFGGLSWNAEHGRKKRRDARTIERGLRRLRARQDDDRPDGRPRLRASLRRD